MTKEDIKQFVGIKLVAYGLVVALQIKRVIEEPDGTFTIYIGDDTMEVE